jgi:hypothetical protein
MAFSTSTLQSVIAVSLYILVPDMAPQDLRCSALSPQSVRVRWDPPPLEHHNGVIEGYKVLYKHISLQRGEKLTPYSKVCKPQHSNM